MAMVSNVHQVLYNKNQNSLPYRCEILRYYGYAAKTVSQWTLTFSLHNDVTETCYIVNYSEFELYLQDEHFEAIANKIGSIFTCLTLVEPKV